MSRRWNKDKKEYESANMLDNFRNYSYHHVLVAVRNTTQIKNLLDKSADDINSIIDKAIGEKIVNNGIIITNSTRSSNYFIDNITINTNIAPNTGGLTYSQYVDAEMTIVEPNTSNFFLFLHQVSSSLGGKPTDLIYVLITFFRGIDIVTETTRTIALNPQVFWMSSATAGFNESGSNYNLKLMGVKSLGLSNDFSKFSLNVATSVKSGTFGNAIKQLNTNIENKLKSEYSVSANKNKNLKVVITIPKEWESYKLSTPNKNKTSETDFTKNTRDTQSIGGDVIFHKPHCRFVDMIEDIIRVTPELLALGNTKKTYPIQVAIDTQTIIDDESCTLYLHVIPFVVRNKMKDTDLAVSEDTLVHYDYIFSGKNNDILTYDIKVEEAITLLGSEAVPSFFKRDTQITKADVLNAPSTDIQNNDYSLANQKMGDVNDKSIQSPTFVPVSSYLDSTYFTGDANQIQNILGYKANFANVLNAGVKLEFTIRGNPLYLHATKSYVTITNTDYQQNISNMYNAYSKMLKGDDSSTYRLNSIDTQYAFIPYNVKISIKTPLKSDMKDPDNKLVDFFYSGHYLLISIKHVFAGGSFTQALTGNLIVLTGSVQQMLQGIGTKQK